MHGRICGPDETLQIDPGVLSDGHGGCRMWNHCHGRGSKCGFRNVEKAVFYIIVNIIIMPTHMLLEVCSNFEYFSSYSSLTRKNLLYYM